MRVIPVIDLMRGQVVRGVGGRREEYRPIQSRLVSSAEPGAVGRALAALGFLEVYLADLDAIAGAAPAWTVYEELSACGLELLVDAGPSTVRQAQQLAQFRSAARPLSAVVAGLESLSGPDVLAAMCAAVGPERFIFSLDLKAGVPLTRGGAFSGLDPVQIAAIALRAGVRRAIVLDLAAVGMDQGVSTLPLCRALACRKVQFQHSSERSRGRPPHFIEIVAGGGVRGRADLQALAAAGADAALVASALHDGRLEAAECAAAR